jgi:ribosomal protein S18 acetylase RimI-like enzyme
VSSLWLALASSHVEFDPSFALRVGAAGEVRQLLEAVLRDPNSAIFVYADGDSRFTGFSAVRIDRAPPILVEGERAEITDLWVERGDRRRGIGRALVASAIAWIRERGVERCEVRVSAGNAEGQAFWRKVGFGDLMDVLHRRL